MKIRTVEMVRKIRDGHYRLLKNKDVKDQLAFYREHARLLEERLARTGHKADVCPSKREAACYDVMERHAKVRRAAEPVAAYRVKRAPKRQKASRTGGGR